jgi:hypothetical protein
MNHNQFGRRGFIATILAALGIKLAIPTPIAPPPTADTIYTESPVFSREVGVDPAIPGSDHTAICVMKARQCGMTSMSQAYHRALWGSSSPFVEMDLKPQPWWIKHAS